MKSAKQAIHFHLCPFPTGLFPMGKQWSPGWDQRTVSQWPLTYRQKTSNIRHTKSQNLSVYRLALQLSLPNTLKPSVKWEWRCSWSSADRRCSNYIWVINIFIANKGVTYIRGFTVPSWFPIIPVKLMKLIAPSSAVTKWCNITWYCMHHCIDWGWI